MSKHAERKSPEQIADDAIFAAVGRGEEPATIVLSIEVLRRTVAAAIREERASQAARALSDPARHDAQPISSESAGGEG